EGKAAGHIGHHAIDSGITEPAAGGTKPRILGLAVRAAANTAARGAVDVAPVEVAFDAEHCLRGLPIVADCAADQAAGEVEVSGRAGIVGPEGSPPSAAAVDAEIQSRPVIGRRDIGGWRLRRNGGTARQIGSGGRSGQCSAKSRGGSEK